MIDKIDDEFNKRQYETHLQDYLDLNLNEHIGGGTSKSRVALVQAHLSAGRSIFEIGSGGGVDALALERAGYTVTASDYSEQFVAVLKAKQLSVTLFDAKRDELPGTYDAIYANAVFVHFSPGELESFLERTKPNLTNDRVIFLSVIQGEGKERRTVASGLERDFQYYSQDQLSNILDKTGFEVLEMQFVDDRWIQVVARAQ